MMPSEEIRAYMEANDCGLIEARDALIKKRRIWRLRELQSKVAHWRNNPAVLGEVLADVLDMMMKDAER